MTPQEFYSQSNLTENPFRSNPVYGSDPRMNIWVGYERQRNQLIKYLSRSRADQVGNSNFVMIYGDYGVGKSHALLWARYQILQSQHAEFDALCYLIPTLKKDKGRLTFAGAFVDDLVDRCGLHKDVREFRNFLDMSILRYRDVNHAGATFTNDEIVDRLGFPAELGALAKEIYRASTAPLINELLMPKGLTDYQATALFSRLVNLFVFGVEINGQVTRFKKAVYLMIDELDELLNVSAKEARDVNDMLRHIYDWCPNCFGLVIALSAESASFSAIFEQYILGRIQRQIQMEELGKEEAMEFVCKILEESRVVKDARKGDYFPFEESAVEAVVAQLRQITPRKIVNTMQEVLEEVRLAGLVPDTQKVDIQFLDEHEILDEVLGDGGIS